MNEMRKYMDKFSNLLNEAKKPKKMVKENMNLGSYPYINVDDDELGWVEDLVNDKSSRANNFRDLYNDLRLQEDAWGIAQMFPTHVLDRLLGEDVNGKSVPFGNIQDLLNQSADTPGFEKYTNEEWELFFETVRTEGI